MLDCEEELVCWEPDYQEPDFCSLMLDPVQQLALGSSC